MRPPYHAGELAVQERAGVRDLAARVERIVAPEMSAPVRAFVEARPHLVVGALDRNGRPWASVLAGPPGFAHAPDARRLDVRAAFAQGDPLHGALHVGAPVGLLALDLASRRRVRVNGVVEHADDAGFALGVRQAFGNCPQHITPRRDVGPAASAAVRTRADDALDGSDLALVAQADTVFVATAHPQGGADVSHRGGPRGFVRATGTRRLELPDYAGNAMLATLGNIEATGRAGLLFLDFARDRALHVTGRARVVWDGARVAAHGGALRLVEIEVERVVSRGAATGRAWD